MKVTYDKEADAMYVEFSRGKFAKNKRVDDLTILDLDKKGNVLGIVILDASKRIQASSISKLGAKRLKVRDIFGKLKWKGSASSIMKGIDREFERRLMKQ